MHEKRLGWCRLGLGLVTLLGTACNEPARLSDGDAAPPLETDGGLDDGGPEVSDAGVDAGEDAGPEVIGPLTMTTSWKDQEIDLFGVPGHRFWLDVDKDQLLAMNTAPSEDQGGGGPIIKDIGPGGGGDIYTPGGEIEPTYADHVVVQDAKTGSIADYGKMEVKLVGQFSRRQWTPTTIPNLHIDTDEFKKRKIGGFEHFRLNNALVGTIFREVVGYRIYRALGYPAVRTSYAFLGSNVWGDDTWVPMPLVEVYKKSFCDANTDLLGGGTCTNMWEFFGDAAQQPAPDWGCQIASCDNSKLDALRAAVAKTPPGEGFGAALDGVLDWPMFHKFQCLSWILETPDDPIHASNNNLIIEREDGKLLWAPYSIDISQGLENWGDVSLYGQSAITTGCQADPACWADTIATCEELISAYKALKPERIVDEAKKTLETLGMLRDGDEERAQQLRDWHVKRQAELSEKLELYRDTADPHGCLKPQVWCEAYGYCTEEKDCPNCAVETPYYCQLNATCMASRDACAAECEAGTVYCDAWKSCIPENDMCGGIIID